MIRNALSFAARLRTGRRFTTKKVGSGSRVDFWKLAPKGANVLHVGDHSMLACRVVFERPGARLQVGHRSFVGLGLMSIAESVAIGDDVMISWGSTIVDHNSHSLRAEQRRRDVERWIEGSKDWTGVKIGAVQIGNRAWLGFNVSVLPGISIGEGAIIGAGAIVTEDIPAWCVAVGNPARVIRELSADERA